MSFLHKSSKKRNRKIWIFFFIILLLFMGLLVFFALRPGMAWFERAYFHYLQSQGPLFVEKQGHWTQCRTGMWIRTDHLKRRDHFVKMKLRIARFDMALFKLELWYGSPRRLEWLMKKTRALAAINGGVFDHRGHPLGIFKWHGKLLNAHINRRQIDGVFFFNEFVFGITQGKGFQHHYFTDVFQSAPLLIDDDQRVTLKYPDKIDRRSVLCIDHQGHLLFIATDGYFKGLSFRELQKLIGRPKEEGGLACRWALNLDGGASSQWGIRRQNGTILRTFGSSLEPFFIQAVPLFLLIQPKRKSTL